MQKIGIVTDEAADIPEDWAKDNEIEIIEGLKEWSNPEISKLPGSNFFQKMREADKRGMKVFVKTAMANLSGFRDAFQKQLQKFQEIICLTVSSKLSGSFNSALQARNSIKEKTRIHIFDTFSGSAGEGLFVLRARELIKKGKRLKEILEDLKEMIPKIELFAFFENPKWIAVSGRVPRQIESWVKRMKKWHFQPYFTIKKGRVVPGITRAKDEISAILKKAKSKAKTNRYFRAFISHGDCSEKAKKIKENLENLGFEVPLVTLASPIVAGHTGPGTVICAWVPQNMSGQFNSK